MREFIRNYIKNELNESNFISKLFTKKDNREKLNITPDIWIHATHTLEPIEKIQHSGKFIGKKESLDDFNIEKKGSFGSLTNTHAPNFKKGAIFSGYEIAPYLITTKLPDDAFQPNWNRKNYNNLNDSQNVAVLKPNFRDIKYFEFWERKNDGTYIKL